MASSAPVGETMRVQNNAPARTRAARAAVSDREAREKDRLRARREGYSHYADPGHVVAPAEGTSGFLGGRERFAQGSAADLVREQRDAAAAARATELARLARVENERAAALAERDAAEKALAEARLASMQGETGRSRRNRSGMSYDPITLSYHESPAGDALRASDDVLRHKAAVRAHTLATKSRGAGYNLLTGEDAPLGRTPVLGHASIGGPSSSSAAPLPSAVSASGAPVGAPLGGGHWADAAPPAHSASRPITTGARMTLANNTRPCGAPSPDVRNACHAQGVMADGVLFTVTGDGDETAEGFALLDEYLLRDGDERDVRGLVQTAREALRSLHDPACNTVDALNALANACEQLNTASPLDLTDTLVPRDGDAEDVVPAPTPIAKLLQSALLTVSSCDAIAGLDAALWEATARLHAVAYVSLQRLMREACVDSAADVCLQVTAAVCMIAIASLHIAAHSHGAGCSAGLQAALLHRAQRWLQLLRRCALRVGSHVGVLGSLHTIAAADRLHTAAASVDVPRGDGSAAVAASTAATSSGCDVCRVLQQSACDGERECVYMDGALLAVRSWTHSVCTMLYVVAADESMLPFMDDAFRRAVQQSVDHVCARVCACVEAVTHTRGCGCAARLAACVGRRATAGALSASEEVRWLQACAWQVLDAALPA